MNRHRWIYVLLLGIVVGLVIAAIATIDDWRQNPGGIFHGEEGTDWTVVTDTAISWFLPVAATATVLGALALLLAARRG